MGVGKKIPIQNVIHVFSPNKLDVCQTFKLTTCPVTTTDIAVAPQDVPYHEAVVYVSKFFIILTGYTTDADKLGNWGLSCPLSVPFSVVFSSSFLPYHI